MRPTHIVTILAANRTVVSRHSVIAPWKGKYFLVARGSIGSQAHRFPFLQQSKTNDLGYRGVEKTNAYYLGGLNERDASLRRQEKTLRLLLRASTVDDQDCGGFKTGRIKNIVGVGKMVIDDVNFSRIGLSEEIVPVAGVPKPIIFPGRLDDIVQNDRVDIGDRGDSQLGHAGFDGETGKSARVLFAVGAFFT